jgi:beta-lactamase class A
MDPVMANTTTPPELPSPMPTPQATPQEIIEQIFTASEIEADWFTEEFLSAVSLDTIVSSLDELKTFLGAYQATQVEGDHYLVLFEQGSVPVYITLDSLGRISGLWVQPPRANALPLEYVLPQFASFPGYASLLILENDIEIAAHNVDLPLAVGSAFKLAVLLALKQMIDAGTPLTVPGAEEPMPISWSTVVALQPEWRSLPSGILHSWSEGSVLTIETLASLMISLSDNTATDALIHLVGREQIEQLTPRNTPFLTTRDAFVLKDPGNEGVKIQFLNASDYQQRTFLAQLNTLPLPNVSIFGSNPVSPEVEWFFSTRELCQLMAQVADIPAMQISPGVADPSHWQQISFKGGSEPGVLNLTTWLKSDTGKTYCVSATWNNIDTAFDSNSLTLLYGSIIEGLKQYR